MQASSETLQEFAAAVEQLAHRAFVGLPVAFIQIQAAHSFIDGVGDWEVKQPFATTGPGGGDAMETWRQTKICQALTGR